MGMYMICVRMKEAWLLLFPWEVFPYRVAVKGSWKKRGDFVIKKKTLTLEELHLILYVKPRLMKPGLPCQPPCFWLETPALSFCHTLSRCLNESLSEIPPIPTTTKQTMGHRTMAVDFCLSSLTMRDNLGGIFNWPVWAGGLITGSKTCLPVPFKPQISHRWNSKGNSWNMTFLTWTRSSGTCLLFSSTLIGGMIQSLLTLTSPLPWFLHG